MRKIRLLLLVALMISLTACAADASAHTDVASDAVPENYGEAIEMAQAEFRSVFSEFQELEITDTVTAVRADDANVMIVQINYTSQNGSGVYGFEMRKDENGNVEILQQGTHVTLNALLEGIGK